MVFPIMPTQRNNYNPRIKHVSNNRISSSTNRTANASGIQQMIGNLSNPNSTVGNLATKGLGDISKTLSNVDQVIKVVRSATPIVQEYGPMVKNLPAMYRMVKAFSQVEDSSENKTDSSTSNQKDPKDSIDEQETTSFRGKSTPRIYI